MSRAELCNMMVQDPETVRPALAMGQCVQLPRPRALHQGREKHPVAEGTAQGKVWIPENKQALVSICPHY